jgi:hypothetical protein
VIIADPNEILDYAWDFAPDLAVGETITTKTVTVPTGLTLSPAGKPAPAIVGSTVVFWLTGGTLNSTYDITVHIVTSAGREYDLTDTLWILSR